MTAYPSSRPPRPAVTEREIEAVTVAMIVAPGVYARNRMFDFFRKPSALKARKRASVVRGVVPQLARAQAVTLTPSGEEAWTLRYVVPAVSLTRVVELSRVELAALRVIAERAQVTALPASPSDKELVAKSLAKLMIEE